MIEEIPEKYFRGYATIDLDKIYRNIEKMKEKLAPETGIVAVIKTEHQSCLPFLLRALDSQASDMDAGGFC